MPEAKCLNNAISLLAQASLNTISEFLVACFPIPIVMHLEMRRSQRFAILGLLSLGFLVAACGSVRTYYLWLVFRDYDFTWWAVPHWIVSEVEIDVSMVGFLWLKSSAIATNRSMSDLCMRPSAKTSIRPRESRWLGCSVASQHQ